ncbi:type II toxin-antitoxin system HicA family toxin [Candidatus Falkowbacteria bacterium]|nr:type II toxin-antitoxin system HicA family toxin [Candidatus Falkowbacteria bacterium]
MSKSRILSAREIIKVLEQGFGFKVVSQKGSHIKLQKSDSVGMRMTVVPNHKEVARGTLKGVLNLAKINEDDFWSKYYNLK